MHYVNKGGRGMPHSSGGGGGSFGGGGGSFGGGSSGSGGSSSRVSRTYFPGATRYVYYDGGAPHYIYSNNDPGKNAGKWRYLFLLFYIPFFAVIWPLMADIRHAPAKLEMDYDARVVIEADASIMGDIMELAGALEDFRDETGITPALVTVNNEEWEGRTSLEDYAYDYYVKRFSDEKHWLIMYSEPKDPKDNDKYYWEGMQGNDTDDILNDKYLDEFNGNLNDLLAQGNRPDVTGSVTKAFRNITPKVMTPYISFGKIGVGIFFVGFLVVHFIIMTVSLIRMGKYKTAVPISLNIGETKCTSCGGGYIKGTCKTCPHCGAPIGREEDINIRTDEHTAGVTTTSGAVATPIPQSELDEYLYTNTGKVRAEDIDDSELPLSKRVKGIFKSKNDEE